MLEFSVKQQTLNFFFYVLAGISVGLLFDGFRAVRVRYKRNRLLTHILDIIFGICCAVYLIMVFYQLDGLMLSIFNLIGAVCGLILYFLMFCRFFRAFFQKILGVFIKIFKILLYPILFLCKIGIRLFHFFKKIFMRFSKRFLKRGKCIRAYFGSGIGRLKKKLRKN